jgi:rhomboid domain-containing protein 1
MHIESYIIILIMVIIFFSSYNFYQTGSEIANYNLNSLYHANLTHLLVNMFSLYNLSFLEDVLGEGQFLFAILFIWIVSSILLYLLHSLVPSIKRPTVGFSGVIFGLIVVFYFTMNINKADIMTRLVASIVPQLFMPGISIEGHFCGIIAGLMYVTLFEGYIKKMN